MRKSGKFFQPCLETHLVLVGDIEDVVLRNNGLQPQAAHPTQTHVVPMKVPRFCSMIPAPEVAHTAGDQQREFILAVTH